MSNALRAWISVGYTGRYSDTYRSKERTARYRALVPVVLARIDAPVAAEIDSLPGARTPIQFRWDGASFWRPMLREDDATTLSEEEFVRRADPVTAPPMSAAWLDWPFPRRTPSGASGNETYEDPFLLPGNDQCRGYWRGDDLRRVHAEAQSVANDVAIMDGIVHLRCEEPRLRLHAMRGLMVHPGLPGRHADLKDIGSTVDARIDQHARMIALAEAWRGKDDMQFSSLPEASIRVVMPEAFAFDDVADAADDLFERFLQRSRAMIGHRVSSAAIRAWTDIKDAGDAYRGGDAAGLVDGLDAFGRFISEDAASYPALRHLETIDQAGMNRMKIAHDLLLRPLLSDRSFEELAAFHL